MAPAAPGAMRSVERFFELSLVGLLASGLLALVGSGYLDLPAVILAGVALLLRVTVVTGLLRPRFSRRALASLALAGVAFLSVDYPLLSHSLLPAGLHLLFFLLALAVLATPPGRGHWMLALVAFGALLVASWLSTRLHFLAALAAFLLFSVAVFAGAEARRSARKARQVVQGPARGLHWRLAVLSGFLAVGILVLTGGMFFVLPRTAQVAFQRLALERARLPAFPDEVLPGQIPRLRQRGAPVMRVRFYGGRPAVELKWRGEALARFDGRRWFNPPHAAERLPARDGLVQLADNRQLWRAGPRLTCEVRLAPMASDTLFLPGTPEFLRINAPAVVRTAGGGVRLSAGTSEGLRYAVYTLAEAGPPPATEAAGPDVPQSPCCLDLPPLDPRIAALARRLTEGRQSEEGRARALEEHLLRHYGYTARPSFTPGADPLTDFLFRRPQGHCELFSSALAVMLRAVGIPSRVVTGFAGGAHNPVSGWQVIRASDAHTWVEAWLRGRGWTSFDPTPPAVARATSPPLWRWLAWYVDAAETFWEEWVLRYDLDRQVVLASKMESSGRSLSTRWRDRFWARAAQFRQALAAWDWRHAVGALILVALAIAGVRLACRVRSHWEARRRLRRVERGAGRPSDAGLLYERMLAVLGRRGFSKPAWQTPLEFVRVLPPSPGAGFVGEFTSAYNELRFGQRLQATGRLTLLLAEIERAHWPSRRG